MGNHRLRLSDMMPNAWFYKLRDISTTRKHSHPPNHKPSSLSPPSRAKIQQNPVSAAQNTSRHSFNSGSTKRKTIYKPSPQSSSSSSVSAGSTTHSLRTHNNNNNNNNKTNIHHQVSALESPSESFPTEFDNNDDDDDDDVVLFTRFADQLLPCSGFSELKISPSADDITIHMNNDSFTGKRFEEVNRFDAVSALELPSLSTKTKSASPTSQQISDLKKRNPPVKVKKEKHAEDISRIQKKHQKHPNPSGIKLGVTSHKIQASARKSMSRSRSGVSKSFAVVKSSDDPEKDFKESMLEMIGKYSIRASKDLEDRLACYLSLNTKEYHDLIIKVFTQVCIKSQSYIHHNSNVLVGQVTIHQ